MSEVRAQFQLSLFGAKISLSLSPEEDQPARTEFAKSSEDAPVRNADDPSFSPSSSGSEDEKIRLTTDKEALAQVPVRETDVSRSEHNKTQLKRPDKPVPCPRCNSLDTKFCYYNNYNVNQPRHFCKNCQRYWTAGGTLRNVPVGAGRRKNKAGRGDGVVPRANPVQEGNKLRQRAYTGCKRSLEVPTNGAGVVRQRKGGGACSEDTGSLQRSSSGASDGSNDSRDDSTCGSSISNPVPQESKGCFQPGMFTPAVNNNNNNHNAPEHGRGGVWHGFPWPVPTAWCPTSWNATWNTPWGNLAATAASAAARAIADNVGSLPWRHLREETTSNRGSLVWAPKTLRVDARAGSRTFLGDIGTGNKVELSISTGGMFKAFQQENGTRTTTALNKSTTITTTSSEDVEEANKVDTNGTVAA